MSETKITINGPVGVIQTELSDALLEHIVNFVTEKAREKHVISGDTAVMYDEQRILELLKKELEG